MSGSDVVRRGKALQIGVFGFKLALTQLFEIFERRAGPGGAGQTDQRPRRSPPAFDPEHPILLGDRYLVSGLQTQSSPVLGWQDQATLLIELQANNRAEFLAGASQLGSIVRGCDIRRQWVDGDQVCSIYDFKIETPLGAGSIPMAEWSVVRDGQLVSSRLLFDTAAMAALMPAS
jgi:hypothetical protein